MFVPGILLRADLPVIYNSPAGEMQLVIYAGVIRPDYCCIYVQTKEDLRLLEVSVQCCKNASACWADLGPTPSNAILAWERL